MTAILTVSSCALAIKIVTVQASAAGTTVAAPPPPPAPAAQGPLPSAGLADDYVPPFSAEPVSLSKVLQEAARNNLDLAAGNVDVKISEARVLAALGAYDLTLTANLGAGITEMPQRGSQFALSLGARRIGGGIGFQRALETGGSIALTVDTGRTRTQQPTNLLDLEQGRTTLSAYSIVPSLTLTHALLRGVGLKVNRAPIDKAKIAATAAEAEQLATAQRLARDLIGSYWDLLYAHRDLINKRRSVQQVERQYVITRKLVKAGRRSRVDAKVVQQAHAAREAEVLAAENTLLSASLELRTLMGHKLDTTDKFGILPTTDPVVKPRMLVLEDEVKRALKANPDLQQAKLVLASHRIDRRVARNRRLPKLDVSGTFTPQGRSIDTVANPASGRAGNRGSWGRAFRNIFNEDISNQGLLADWTLTGTVTLTWDVRNRRAKGELQEAELQIEKAELLIERARQQIAASVIRAATTLRTAGKVIEVAELSYELAQDNLAAEQSRFELGRATSFDVLLRLDEVDSAAAEALGAQVDYLKALAELQALTGEILPAYGLAP